MLEILNKIVSGVVTAVAGWTALFWGNLNLVNVAPYQIVLDVLLVAVIFYWIFLVIRGTRAVPVILGIVVLAMFSLVASSLELVALSWLFEHLVTVLIVALPIIFQPELRRGLERLGHSPRFSLEISNEQQKAIDAVVRTVEDFRQNSVGATVVFERMTPLGEYADTGLALNADVSAELLEAIFQKKSPLHDGAVIIAKGKVVAAGAVLPLALVKASKDWGTRHKSALGLAEQSDAIVVTVSEERGRISIFEEGQVVEGVSPEKVRFVLEEGLIPSMWRRKFILKRKK